MELAASTVAVNSINNACFILTADWTKRFFFFYQQ